jgi:dihydrodipicolinate synthase/N-acetylneuraminate lyase
LGSNFIEPRGVVGIFDAMNSRREFPRPLAGIVPPMLSPLTDRDTLDMAGLERLVEHLISGGVHGVFILGTTGEGPSLSYRLRRELIERTAKLVKQRIPILVGITDTAFVESVNLAGHAADCGADAVVLAPPYYLPEGQPELREYLEHLLPELRVPLFLYNMPPLTKVSFELDIVRWAMQQPNIVGIKDSSGDMNYYRSLCELIPMRADWTVLLGPEELLLQSMAFGGHGGVAGGANVFPKLYVALFDAARAGDNARAKVLQERIQQIGQQLYRVGKHPSTIIKGIKCAASCLGICSDFMAEPLHRFRAPERERIEQAMKELIDFANPQKNYLTHGPVLTD